LGLGGASFADSVVVRWPSGVKETYFTVAAGLVRVEEGAVATAIGGATLPSGPRTGSPPWRVDIRPQPARGAQSILVSSAEVISLELSIHDATGRLIRRLHRGPLGPGETEVLWDGRDRSGGPVASGVYFLRVEEDDGGGSTQMEKLVRVR
jgi:hypothetical protein